MQPTRCQMPGNSGGSEPPKEGGPTGDCTSGWKGLPCIPRRDETMHNKGGIICRFVPRNLEQDQLNGPLNLRI